MTREVTQIDDTANDGAAAGQRLMMTIEKLQWSALSRKKHDEQPQQNANEESVPFYFIVKCIKLTFTHTRPELARCWFNVHHQYVVKQS